MHRIGFESCLKNKNANYYLNNLCLIKMFCAWKSALKEEDINFVKQKATIYDPGNPSSFFK
jgi:hypothetical protein